MKLFLVCAAEIGETAVYDAKVFPFNDANRPTQRAAALEYATDIGGVCYKVTDAASTVELPRRTTPVYQGLSMAQSKALRDYALSQGWQALVDAIQAAIKAAKAA